jgi:hypothetical protein
MPPSIYRGWTTVPAELAGFYALTVLRDGSPVAQGIFDNPEWLPYAAGSWPWLAAWWRPLYRLGLTAYDFHHVTPFGEEEEEKPPTVEWSASFYAPVAAQKFRNGQSLSGALAATKLRDDAKFQGLIDAQRSLEAAAASQAVEAFATSEEWRWPAPALKLYSSLLGGNESMRRTAALVSWLRAIGVSRADAVSIATTGTDPRARAGARTLVAGEGNPGVWGAGDQMRIANELAPMVADLDGFPTREGRAYALRTHAQNSAPANLFIQTFIYGGDQVTRIAQTRAVYIDTAQTQLLPLDFGNPGSGWMLLASRVDPGPWKEPSS